METMPDASPGKEEEEKKKDAEARSSWLWCGGDYRIRTSFGSFVDKL